MMLLLVVVVMVVAVAAKVAKVAMDIRMAQLARTVASARACGT